MRKFLIFLVLTAAAMLCLPTPSMAQDAKASDVKVKQEVKKDAHPLQGSAGFSYSFNHANFVAVEENSEFGEADFGYMRIGVNAGLGYTLKKKYRLSFGTGAGKCLKASFLNPCASSKTVRKPWEWSGFSLGFSASKLAEVKVLKMTVNGGMGLSFPFTKAAQAAGLLLSASPNIGLSFALTKKLGLSIGGSYTYNLHENPTRRIDCEKAPENCLISGQDLGAPNTMHSLGASIGLSYKAHKQVSLSTRYSVSNGIKAVKFADDEFTSSAAQADYQLGTGGQSFSFATRYAFMKQTSLSASVRTSGSLYTSDNKNYRFPLFDIESNLHNATVYGISLSRTLQ